MAIAVLGRDSSADGTWQIDYDDVALTVGHTCTGDFGKGRVVDFSNVPNSEVPPHIKGQAYSFTFGGIWS